VSQDQAIQISSVPTLTNNMDHRWAPLLFLVLLASAKHVQGWSWAEHPMLTEVQDAIDELNARLAAGEINGPDPNAYWMEQFLNLIKDKLPPKAVAAGDLQNNLERLAEYDHKGYLKAIAKGEMSAEELTWPDEDLRPIIIPAYMPVLTEEDPEPVIKLEQIYKGTKVYKEILGPNARKRRRRAAGLDTEEEPEHMPRAFHINPESFNEDIPYMDDHYVDHDVHEADYDEDTGEELSRSRRALPEGMVVYPQKGTMAYVAAIAVKANATTGEIIWPDN